MTRKIDYFFIVFCLVSFINCTSNKVQNITIDKVENEDSLTYVEVFDSTINTFVSYYLNSKNMFHGELIKYDSLGNPREIYNLKNNTVIGYVKEYDENKKLKGLKNYREEKNGVITINELIFFNPDGSLNKRSIFMDKSKIRIINKTKIENLFFYPYPVASIEVNVKGNDYKISDSTKYIKKIKESNFNIDFSPLNINEDDIIQFYLKHYDEEDSKHLGFFIEFDTKGNPTNFVLKD